MPEETPLPLSALQHAAFCLRQAALIHLDRLWQDNSLTAEGEVFHEHVDTAGQRTRKNIRIATKLPLISKHYHIAGIADVVEFHKGEQGETPYPIEYKRGKPKQHHADEIQLCAQAFCLEEMTGQNVPEGALFYGKTRRRTKVTFDDPLRQLTISTIEKLTGIIQTRQLPPAIYQAKTCKACSLYELCSPRLAGKKASLWLQKQITKSLKDETS